MLFALVTDLGVWYLIFGVSIGFSVYQTYLVSRWSEAKDLQVPYNPLWMRDAANTAPHREAVSPLMKAQSVCWERVVRTRTGRIHLAVQWSYISGDDVLAPGPPLLQREPCGSCLTSQVTMCDPRVGMAP